MAVVMMRFFLRLPPFTDEKTDQLSDSVPPDVKTISFSLQFKMPQNMSFASLICASASTPF